MTLTEIAQQSRYPPAWIVEHPDGTRRVHPLGAWPEMPSGSSLTLTRAALDASEEDTREPRR